MNEYRVYLRQRAYPSASWEWLPLTKADREAVWNDEDEAVWLRCTSKSRR